MVNPNPNSKRKRRCKHLDLGVPFSYLVLILVAGVHAFQSTCHIRKPQIHHHLLFNSPWRHPQPLQSTYVKSRQATSNSALFGIKGFRSWFESQFPNAMDAIPKATAHDKFDHVLIDMNQLLHVCLRKSRSEGHALTMLMKELDECCQLATPTKSLVLAMDGPPSASKLATQRQRRLQTIVRTERKINQMDQLSSSGRQVFSKRKQESKRRRYAAETRTLCITPGTDFMKLTEHCILYWAWQRQQNNNKNHFLNQVKIYISPSTVAGEGEVKLLEWILRQRKWDTGKHQGESIAILGGDSDLVLEGLVIPPSISHNVFVLLPDGNRKYLSVSLWETTKTLNQFLPKHLPSEATMRVRTDLVLLLILNGNDYFPKLRGSSGFHKVFHAYLRTLREWLADDDKDDQSAFLVEPEALTYNVDFCIAFFTRLKQLAPPSLLWSQQQNATGPDGEYIDHGRASRITPLAKFNSLVDSGFFPKPIYWKVLDVRGKSEDDFDEDDAEEEDFMEDEEGITHDLEEDDDEDDDEEDLDDDELDEEGEETLDATSNAQQLISLQIGKPGTDDFVSYEIWQSRKKTMKRAKHRLASMALEDLFGDLGEYFDGNFMEGSFGDGDGQDTYAWDIRRPVDGKPDTYLGGLLWNLQTYQDGVCPDYSFNYGKRHAPTANEIVSFLEDSKQNHAQLGIRQLIGNSATDSAKNDDSKYPISAGVSCLAALPSDVRDLVPEPYRYLDTKTVEECFGQCMDPSDNVFDMKRFEKLCDEKVMELGHVNGSSGIAASLPTSTMSEMQKIDQSHYWIVLSKSKMPLKRPINPPPPFSDRLSELRPNNRISVKRIKAVWQPRPRAFRDKESPEVHDSFLSRFDSLNKVHYKSAYKKSTKKSKQTEGKPKELPPDFTEVESTASSRKKKKLHSPAIVTERMLSYKIKQPPKKPLTTTDGQSALACLKQLEDAGFIGEIKWSITVPSPSSYASFNPDEHELVGLTVAKSENDNLSILDEFLAYEQDRDVNRNSRQSIKHHLADFAISEITGKDIKWTNGTFKDLKDYIVKKHNVASETT